MARGKNLQIQSTFAVFVIFLLLSFLTIYLENKGVFSGLHKFVGSTIRPVRESLFRTRMSLLLPFEFLREYKRINERIVGLENNLADASTKLGELGSLREENKRMKSLLGTNLPPAWKFETSRVIGVRNDEIHLLSPSFKPKVSTPIIIPEKDEPQIGDKGVFVAKVERVVGEEIVGILPTHTLSKIGALVRSKDTGERRASGILIGKGGEAILDQVLSGDNIEEGDLIVTNGEGNLPADLLLGYVGKVFQNESSPWKQSEVKPVIQSDKLDYAFLLSKF